MRIGIFAKTFIGTDPETVLTAARQAGYRAVQYNMACSGLPSMPDRIPDGTAPAMRDAAQRTGVSIIAISATYNMIHPDVQVRQRGQASLEQIAAVARDAGVPLLTLCTGTRDTDDQWRHHPDNGTEDAWRDLLASMDVALTIAERYGVDLGIEPELGNVVASPVLAKRLITELGSARLKIVLDPANLFEVATNGRQREIVADAVATLADRIVMAHAKDRDAQGRFTTAGSGVIDFPFYIRCLRDAGFAGDLVTHGLSEVEASSVAKYLAEVLAPSEAPA
jgi:sugar phosphate isomerase/epimerase